MGNVNGRDGDMGPSEKAFEALEEEGFAHGQSVDLGEGRIGPYSVHGVSPGLIGHSPPHSPRTTHSPLMFGPQTPVLPLQRPDDMNIPSNSWMQSMVGHEEIRNEQRIPTMITWSYGGKEVSVEGSWDNWKTRKPMQRSGKDFIIMKVLPSGVYQYRFIVDGQWRYSPDMPWSRDDSGNTYNILDLQEYIPDELESISGFEPPQSPESSYNNAHIGAEDYAKDPPMVPPHLQMTLLNVPSSHMEVTPTLSRPPHVVLNHLYMQKGKGGPSVVALGSTHRFLAKYVTVVLYKSLQR